MLDLEKFIKRMPNVTAAGWNYTAKFICGNQGWHLVSLHSKTEQDFVSYYLQHRLQSRRHFRNSTGYYGYAYLGKITMAVHVQYFFRCFVFIINAFCESASLLIK